jgi:hypothetical protein
VRTAGGETWREAGSLAPDDHVVIDLSSGQVGQPRLLTPVRGITTRSTTISPVSSTRPSRGSDGSTATARSRRDQPENPSPRRSATGSGVADVVRAAHQVGVRQSIHTSRPPQRQDDAPVSVRFFVEGDPFPRAHGRKGKAVELRVPTLSSLRPPVRAAPSTFRG